MKFQKGHKLAKGGKRKGAGRPSKTAAEVKKLAAEVARSMIEGSVERLTDRYIRRALGPKADKVLMHAMDKIVPAAKPQPADLNVNHSGEVKQKHEFDYVGFERISAEINRRIAEAGTRAQIGPLNGDGFKESLDTSHPNGSASGIPD